MILLFVNSLLLAQNPLVQHFTTSEGLPSNAVYKIFQDSKKFIWFATDAGVSRYDGTKFVHYGKQDGLSSNEVFNIEEDSSGRIWFFHTNASLNFFYNNSIYNGNNTPYLDSLRTNDYFRKFYEDENKILYFYDHPRLLVYSLDPQNHIVKYQLPSYVVVNQFKPHSIEGMIVRYMKKNARGEFIFWTPAGCFKTKQLSDTPILFDSTYRFREVISSRSSNKYILVREMDSTKYVVKKFNEETGFKGIESIANTGSEYISSILEDSNGLLWISTYDKGVFCMKDKMIIYHFDIKDAKSVIQDHEKNIWISSMKEGVYKISPFFYHHQHFSGPVFENAGIFALGKHDSSGIWCTNGKMIYLFRDPIFYKMDFQHNENSFNQILQVNKNILLVSETNKLPYALIGLRINQAAKKIEFDHVSMSPVVMKKITYNKTKDEICSFNPNFLFLVKPDQMFGKKMRMLRIGQRIFNSYYNSKDELVINAKKNYLYSEKTKREAAELAYFNDKIISDHLNLSDENELFNIEGDSLFILNHKKLINLSSSFEQPIDLQIQHLVYQDSTLYIATSRNIYVCKYPLNILTGKPVVLNLININFKSIHDIVFYNKKLYVANDEGLTAIPQYDLDNSYVTSPIPYFQSIQVNDQENLAKQDQVSLVKSQRINIAFGSINYSVNPNIFSYKLEGTDADWTLVKGNNVVLQNLPKGNYLFKLRVRKPASAWSEPIKFGITVDLTIWQHPLFYFFVILFLAVIAFLFVLRQKNIELGRRQMEHQILQLEQKSHQAMMNPHFLFNSLGSIQNYLLHNKPNEAGIYLSKFARLIRQNLNSINTSMINLEEEIDRLKNYIDLEKIRMGDRFEYLIEINEAVESEEILIPTMIVQPFVENSIWHGVANMEEKGLITICFNLLDDKSLQIIVEDTGVGIKNAEKYKSGSDSHLKLGMNITKKRLQLLSQKYGIETGIHYSEKLPGAINPGTKVVIVVPFLYGSSEESN